MQFMISLLIASEATNSSWSWGIAIPAFLGASLSFISFAFWDKILRARERRVKAVRAVVEIQHLANEIICISDSNAIMLREGAKRSEAAIGNLQKGNLSFTILGLRMLPSIPQGAIADLLSVPLLNLAFKVKMDSGTINTDSKKFDLLYERSVLSADGKDLSPTDFKVLVQHYAQAIERMREHETAYIGMAELAINLFATAEVVYNISIRKDPFVRDLMVPDLKGWEDEIENAKAKLKASILETRKSPTVLALGEEADPEFWRS